MYEWLITEYDLLHACYCPNCKCKWLVTRWKHTEQGWKEYGRVHRFVTFDEAREYSVKLMRKERHKLKML